MLGAVCCSSFSLAGCVFGPHDDVEINNLMEEEVTADVTLEFFSDPETLSSTQSERNSIESPISEQNTSPDSGRPTAENTRSGGEILLEETITLQPRESDGEGKTYADLRGGGVIAIHIAVRGRDEREFHFTHAEGSVRTAFVDIENGNVNYYEGVP
jgi:hypothetical protein